LFSSRSPYLAQTLYKIKMQMKEKMSEHHHIFFSQSFLDEFAVCLRHFKQQFQGFNPRFINFLFSSRYAAVA